MKIELYSIEELSAKGWKYSESNQKIYIGRANFPTMTFSAGLAHLLGKTFSYRGYGVREGSRDIRRVEVEDHSGTYLVPEFLIKTKLKKTRIKAFTIGSTDRPVKFNGTHFNFPCSLQDLHISDARKLAKWVLKQAGAK